MNVVVTNMNANSKLKIVVGIGATGLSVARYLSQMGEHFVMLDTRQNPPCLSQLKAELPDVNVILGELLINSFEHADEVIISPGVSRQIPAIQVALQSEIPVTSDIQLFARAANAPIVAITGSNGKSTVTTLVGEMCVAAGFNVGVGGNLGTPALALLSETVDFYVLELSSFQLESVSELNAEVATVLNISPDHMDRYHSLLDYHQAKHQIFSGARQVVINRADNLTFPLISDQVNQWSFGLSKPGLSGFGLIDKDGIPWLAYESTALMPEADLAMGGRHNTGNALAALALGKAIRLPIDAMLQVLRQYQGLPHRCETVAVVKGVTYINDSKATNVGATLAAIAGLSSTNNLILIAGGEGKGQDFTPLAKVLSGAVKQLVLFGHDATTIGEVVPSHIDKAYADSLESAVIISAKTAQPGDIVLLSPACASFDMFSGFAERGQCFVEAVGRLK